VAFTLVAFDAALLRSISMRYNQCRDVKCDNSATSPSVSACADKSTGRRRAPSNRSAQFRRAHGRISAARTRCCRDRAMRRHRGHSASPRLRSSTSESHNHGMQDAQPAIRGHTRKGCARKNLEDRKGLCESRSRGSPRGKQADSGVSSLWGCQSREADQ